MIDAIRHIPASRGWHPAGYDLGWRRRSIARVSLAVMAISWVLLPVTSESGWAKDAANDVARKIDGIIEPHVAKKEFMGSILVARDGEIVFSKGYGYANVEWGIENSPQIKFHLGSVTKQFTAVSIMLLSDRGLLKLDDPVGKFVEDAPPAWDKITVFHLLTHTAGLHSYTDDSDFDTFRLLPMTPEKIIARIRDKPLKFEPGTDWEYSNSNYALLGYIVEKVSGQTYQQFVQQNIFDRLAMKDSGYISNTVILTNQASGYELTKEGLLEHAINEDPGVPYAAGALYSSTGDLLRWERGLMGGKLLSAGSLKQMITPVSHNYGFGVNIHDENGHTVIEHSGGIEGFNTNVAYYPEDKLVVITLANVNSNLPWVMRPLLAAAARGEPIPAERRGPPH